jgi:hypothetical protein
MPIHDWSRVPAGLYHDFHHSWSIRIKDALNAKLLPKGMTALVEQRTGVVIPDVLAIDLNSGRRPLTGGTATLQKPATRVVQRSGPRVVRRPGEPGGSVAAAGADSVGDRIGVAGKQGRKAFVPRVRGEEPRFPIERDSPARGRSLPADVA